MGFTLSGKLHMYKRLLSPPLQTQGKTDWTLDTNYQSCAHVARKVASGKLYNKTPVVVYVAVKSVSVFKCGS